MRPRILGLAAIVLSVGFRHAMSLPPEPIDPILKQNASVFVSNCNPGTGELKLQVSPGATLNPVKKTLMNDGRVRLDFSFVVGPEPKEGSWKLTPRVTGGLCAGGSFSPASRTLTSLPTQGVSFQYQGIPGQSHRISAPDLANVIDLFLNSLKLKLHNHKAQDSFLQIAGQQVKFDIPRVTVDIDCGTLCPDLGDGYFYLNDINLRDANFDWDRPNFVLALSFEDEAREIKGYHSKLGDTGMPDFDLHNIRLSLKALPKATGTGELSLGFFAPDLDADIQSTGGCSIAGIDICNKIFKTDRKIQKAVESASMALLNGSLAQAKIASALRQFLQLKGIQGRVLSVRVEGAEIVVVTR